MPNNQFNASLAKEQGPQRSCLLKRVVHRGICYRKPIVWSFVIYRILTGITQTKKEEY
jgi:hypothetical protein